MQIIKIYNLTKVAIKTKTPPFFGRFYHVHLAFKDDNFKTAEKYSPKPFRIGLRAFFFKKQSNKRG